MKCLITTTINVPDVLTQWAEGLTTKDWIIVAGDMKSPHAEIRHLLDEIMDQLEINTLYLDPERQMQYAMSSVTGWNCIQRRNIALLEAMKLEPEYIITIDDDNYPTRGDEQLKYLETKFSPGTDQNIFHVGLESDGWWNPSRYLSAADPHGMPVTVVHRGFPHSQRFAFHARTEDDPFFDKIGVAAMLWTGDPDIDAVERLVNRPNVMRSETDLILGPGTWAPFNSQATMYRSELAPLMMVWPGVGRYDDIWASYLARKVMDHFGYAVYYGSPVVHQDRNEHNLIVDLKAELFGMQYNEQVITELRTCDLVEYETDRQKLTIREAMEFVQGYLMGSNILPQQTKDSFKAWASDLDNLGIK